ncbi:MAG: glycosyltransferase, partial [Bacteroidaceae bacterium]|nr:glycosyltransferase [Bacteroidaceae bacterium]
MPVSLIITTYNNTVSLERCLKSVAAQTVMPDEIVIGDDGSTEETRALIDAWRERINAPIVYVWQEDKGFRASRIRNMSFAHAKNDYLIIIDGD